MAGIDTTAPAAVVTGGGMPDAVGLGDLKDTLAAHGSADPARQELIEPDRDSIVIDRAQGIQTTAGPAKRRGRCRISLRSRNLFVCR